jgi:hypothetical protein
VAARIPEQRGSSRPWRPGADDAPQAGRARGAYDCIKAFSETDLTEELWRIDVPTLIVRGDDDQGVRRLASARGRGGPWGVGLAAIAARAGRERSALGSNGWRLARPGCRQPGAGLVVRQGLVALWAVKEPVGDASWEFAHGDHPGVAIGAGHYRSRSPRRGGSGDAAARCSSVWRRRPASVVRLNYLGPRSRTVSAVALERVKWVGSGAWWEAFRRHVETPQMASAKSRGPGDPCRQLMAWPGRGRWALRAGRSWQR